MFNLDDITNENDKERNKKWPFTPDHPYRIFDNWWFWIRKKNDCLI